jgi:plastocyanin
VLAPHAIAADQTVVISRAGFVPPDVTVDTGDRVTWNGKVGVRTETVSEVLWAPRELASVTRATRRSRRRRSV